MRKDIKGQIISSFLVKMYKEKYLGHKDSWYTNLLKGWVLELIVFAAQNYINNFVPIISVKFF